MTFVTDDSTLNRGLDATKQAIRKLQSFYKISKQLSIWDLPQSQFHKQSSHRKTIPLQPQQFPYNRSNSPTPLSEVAHG